VLDGVGGQRYARAVVPPGKTRYPLYRRPGGPQGLFERARKISPPNGIRSPDSPACSESPYRLRYPGPSYIHVKFTNVAADGGLDSCGIKRFPKAHRFRDKHCVTNTSYEVNANEGSNLIPPYPK